MSCVPNSWKFKNRNYRSSRYLSFTPICVCPNTLGSTCCLPFFNKFNGSSCLDYCLFDFWMDFASNTPSLMEYFLVRVGYVVGHIGSVVKSLKQFIHVLVSSSYRPSLLQNTHTPLNITRIHPKSLWRFKTSMLLTPPITFLTLLTSFNVSTFIPILCQSNFRQQGLK